ncbi:splicing factor, Prp19-binding domain-containing protein [Lenzites betulinus]|nr:splicing factor, Prp19-binding domain-containing protein [Lenzites betulinus]
MSSAARKPAARLPRPAARYWKGKAPKGADAAESDSDYDEAEEQEPQEEGDELIRGVGDEGDEEEEDEDFAVRKEAVGRQARGAINVALRDVNISKEGKVIVAGKEESGKTAAELEEEEEEEESEEEEEAEEEESSEEESESEEEKPKLQFRPVFVPKRARITIAEKEAMAEDSEEAIKRKEAEAEERKKASHDMVAEIIRRELLEKEKEEEVPDVDDTDGLDPAGEFEAWRLRELARIKRDKEAALARELEREEIERRRALPEEQRLKEDLERAEKLRADKPKGQQKFLQKYWHKGAFHQDDEVLKRHDYTEATESTMDISLLPKVMQVRNFGKRSRTKYTHLLDQDTTSSTGGFGGTGSLKAGGTSTAGGGCFLCGGPHLKKDCPQNANLPPGQTATGANSAPTGSRQWGAPPPPRDGARDEKRGAWGGRDRDDRPENGDSRDRRRDDDDRPRDRDRERERAIDRERFHRDDRARDSGRDKYDSRDRDRRRSSRSRSPRRDWGRGGDSRKDRRRSRSLSQDRVRDEKRRRVD